LLTRCGAKEAVVWEIHNEHKFILRDKTLPHNYTWWQVLQRKKKKTNNHVNRTRGDALIVLEMASLKGDI
jgi:hypothetical protein